MSQVAKRYAEALFQLASKNQNLVEVSADLKELTAAIEATPALLELLKAPKISSAKKKAMLSEILANANSAVVNTVQLLVDKQRISEVVAVAEEFQALATAASGAAKATVYSTRALTEAESAEISVAFAQLVGKSKLEINNIIEPSILGGIRVQIGNYIYDSTIASKLEGLKRTLVV
ncbi:MULTISPECIES: F0F1 ATP synthase subunit delta [Bacillales]|uniref:ATP synthase subunit delta n=1 Tax=Lysinibacillus louembei TaxID=1470088 RepID=A0ABZ0S4D8_9BACI|nr:MULTISPECIES: F0F1 ATP synthase subunit delta [Bacillales]MCT6923422.1 F0F1 ATP synthase subunit delta [Metasolibacillus sp.]MCT6939856.1 F0F1 ATP synthase subunit delta [Metasolibacillus sp.]WPK12512.1 F0F1 ATP synthase subunit delta [Lysinibacillus louembei]